MAAQLLFTVWSLLNVESSTGFAINRTYLREVTQLAILDNDLVTRQD
jgi:hypothetical protein